MTDFLPATTTKPPEGEYEVINRKEMGLQMIATYPNGYGASVIIGPYSYGGENGEYELAVLHGKSQRLCYATTITSDVIGHLAPPEVVVLLHQIASLPENPLCSHRVLGRTG